MSSQDLDQNNDSTCKTSVKDSDRCQKTIEDVEIDDFKGKNEKKYQDHVKSINYLRRFDWLDTNNPQNKTPPIKLLTPAAFWFMVCAEYFPRSLTKGSQSPSDTLQEYIQKIERQQIQQIIRVKDMSYQGLKNEQIDEQTQEQIQKIKQEIRKIKFERPQANIRNSAELKEDYTFEDDLYIMEMRNDLLDLYTNYLNLEQQQNNQQNCSSSVSTMIEDDSHQSYISKDDLGVISIENEKQNAKISGLAVKNIDEEYNNTNPEEQTTNQDNEDDLQNKKPKSVEQLNEDMQIEIQVNIDQLRNADQIEDKDYNICEEEENQEQKQSDEYSDYKDQEDKFNFNIPKLKERGINSEEVLKLMKKQDLDDIINLYQYHLVQQEGELNKITDKLKQDIEKDLISEKIIYGEQELDMTNLLVDIHQYNNIEQEYLNFLENRQQYIDLETLRQNQNQCQKKQNIKQHDKGSIEDMACQICNDGDYTDDDLIVFCSKCNISVHQRCYGIPKIPNDDWICELCLSFGPEGKYLRCSLCTKRGGAMKPSKVPITSNIFQNTNTQYYEFQKTCKAGPPNKKQRYDDPNEKQSKPGSGSKQTTQNEEVEEENDSNKQYYDYHFLKEFTEEELKNEPKPYFVWCHVSCALWTPECFFDDKNYYSNIKGLENIDKQRFKLECSICKQKKAGACIQCARTKCMEAFHPECARRENIYMEVRNTDKLAYLIYCERHTPLQLRRLLEQKEKKYKEEIIKFCKSIEKSREFRKKERTSKKERDRQLQKLQKKLTTKKKILISAKKIRQQITKNEEDQHKEEIEFQQMLINKMIDYVDKLTVDDIKRINELSSLNPNDKENTIDMETSRMKIEEKSSKNDMNNKDPNSVKKINRWQNKVFIRKEEPFWADIQYKTLSTIQIFKRYKKIQRDNAKKKEFKQLYFKTLSAVKNIRIVTKEERLLEKEKKKQEKQQKRQQKIQEIFQKTQDKEKKKLENLQIKEQKDSVKKDKPTKFELSSKAIRRTNNKKKNKINDKKQLKLAKLTDTIDIISIVPHNYEPVDETSEQIYCICKRKYQEGDQMMACEKCDEWYHFECIGYQGTMEKAENIEFVCKFCDHKDSNIQQRKIRKETYGHLFLQYDEPNYDFMKDIIIQNTIILETKECQELQEEKLSTRKRNSSKASKQEKDLQKKLKKDSSSNKQDNSELTTTSKKGKKQNDKKSKNIESKIAEVKIKLDYAEAEEEIFEDEEDDYEQKPNQDLYEDIYDEDLNEEKQQIKKDFSDIQASQEIQEEKLEQQYQEKQTIEENKLINTIEMNENENQQQSSSQSHTCNEKISQEKNIESQKDLEQEENTIKQKEDEIIITINKNKIEEEKDLQEDNKCEDEIISNKENKTQQINQKESEKNTQDENKENNINSQQVNNNVLVEQQSIKQITTQQSCNLSKQTSNPINSQNVSNNETQKKKQKSIKDFFSKK